MLKLIRTVSLLLTICFVQSSSIAQAPKKHNAAEIQLMLQKLNVLGTVLYVAAHPDDENTKLIAYLANEKLYNTAYLSATRGDGGQNLIGPEIRELLGLIRTQELLAARRTDGGQQFFSRANDFGYSKNPDETFNIWDKDQVLSDFVRTFRKFKPDVVITRFPVDGRGGHGHHTASAILAGEAFEASGDASKYPDLAKEFGVWSPKKLFFNTHPYFFGGLDKEDTSQYVTEDLGLYNPLLGKSYPEIASLSRSMHKSQGFGSTGTRGSQVEYFIPIIGDPSTGMFGGIDTSWNRVEGGDKVAAHVENALMSFDATNPELMVDDLIKAYKALDQLEDEHWKKIKKDEVKTIIKACLGLYLEIKANDSAFTPGDSIKLSVEAINRSKVGVMLSSIAIDKLETFSLNQKLQNNSPFHSDKHYVLPQDLEYSQPYWLKKEGTLGMYSVADESLIGTPENEAVLHAIFTVEVEGVYLDYNLPVIFKKNDPVDGEVYQPLEFTPPVFTNIAEKVYVFGSDVSKEVNIIVKAGKANISGSLMIQLPKGWKSSPVNTNFDLKQKGEEQTFQFKVTPPKGQSEGEVVAIANIEGKEYNKSLVRIDYDHIPLQTLFPKSSSKVVKIDFKRRGQNVGYIMGAGDEIPASLRQIGYNVWEMSDEDITAQNLKDLDAVIVGIRAYNTRERMKFHQDKLMKYVENGGTMIVQYNTNHRLNTKELGPYPFQLSRDRVTVEEAEVRILNDKHPLMNVPNKITKKDFEGWVQERGLYFPNEWDEKYEALLSSNDPNEDAKSGGLLVAQYGKGYYIYSGYSWFRELPAGVPGAYRLFTNMISLGNKENLTESKNVKIGVE
ncbi:PIG-L family deacetylase [Reichenbachiella sp. MALMAid0571]|uniref:PIG-L family deacetylase n=1 Tax=Reichenbachiella sp. MALMAid0571 TaxID=3143939 RepID=UPI0032E05103